MIESQSTISEAVRARIAEAQARADEIGGLLMDPAVLADPRRLQELGREQANLAPLLERGTAIIETERKIEENQAALDDPELRDLAQEELRVLTEQHER